LFTFQESRGLPASGCDTPSLLLSRARSRRDCDFALDASDLGHPRLSII